MARFILVQEKKVLLANDFHLAWLFVILVFQIEDHGEHSILVVLRLDRLVVWLVLRVVDDEALALRRGDTHHQLTSVKLKVSEVDPQDEVLFCYQVTLGSPSSFFACNQIVTLAEFHLETHDLLIDGYLAECFLYDLIGQLLQVNLAYLSESLLFQH